MVSQADLTRNPSEHDLAEVVKEVARPAAASYMEQEPGLRFRYRRGLRSPSDHRTSWERVTSDPGMERQGRSSPVLLGIFQLGPVVPRKLLVSPHQYAVCRYKHLGVSVLQLACVAI